eukprot:gene63191-86441_t
MPRFYCDYCDAYLTHDSMTGRQQHMRGWKHRENFRNHYQSLYPAWVQEQQALQMQQMQQFQMMMSPGMFMPPFMPPPMDMSQMMAMGYGNPQQGMMDHGQGQQGP